MNSPMLYYYGGGATIAITALALLYLLFRIVSFNRHATRVPGTVVGGNWQGDGQGGTVCYPVVAFTTATGEQRRFSPNVGTNFPPAVGSAVTVLYDPANPQKVEIKSFIGVWLWLVFYGAFGLVGIVMVASSIYGFATTVPSGYASSFAYLHAFVPFLIGCAFGLVAAALSFFSARRLLFSLLLWGIN